MDLNKIYEIENVIDGNLGEKEIILYDKEMLKYYIMLKNLGYKNIEWVKKLAVKDDKVKEVLSILYGYTNEKVVKNIDELKEIIEKQKFSNNNINDDI